ncbi:MAG: bifunctional oligoribonuclease/PAP phosphatase NrnA [Treponema sp.]|jgi:phosphoesterase RecJ-like protein|nr:bifunctional oligoribonuclease/PAP phosphatase NrnA [Treponema sp.]
MKGGVPANVEDSASFVLEGNYLTVGSAAMYSKNHQKPTALKDGVLNPVANKMIEKLTAFINRHELIILTTHDPADLDGLGAQMIMACVLRERGKNFRIINASPIPKHINCLYPKGLVEQWDNEKHGELPERSGLLMVDTADERTMGHMKEIIGRFREVFVIDHHETEASFPGIADPSAASASEITVELAENMGVAIDPQTAYAAYAGIACDSGFFAFPKTGPRTFRSAITLFELGAQPNEVYHLLRENATVASLLLQKKSISGMTLYCNNRVAVQTLRLADFAETGALPEESEGFVNFPLRAKDIIVSLLLKETQEGKIRCALRSKGKVNVAKIAQELGGGGHLNAAGFKSELDINQTLSLAMEKIARHLDDV